MSQQPDPDARASAPVQVGHEPEPADGGHGDRAHGIDGDEGDAYAADAHGGDAPAADAHAAAAHGGDAHRGDGHGANGLDAPLGPIDLAAWGAGLVGVAAALLIVACLVLATSA